MKKSDILISLIAAIGTNQGIGKDNKLPWHLPTDMQWFKNQTRLKPVVLGRKSHESIVSILGKPLPQRPNYVITRQEDYDPGFKDVRVCHSIKQAIEKARKDHPDKNEIMILGGAEIYRQALEQNVVDRMYLTQVDLAPDSDAYFPEYDVTRWSEKYREDLPARQHEPALSFVILER